MDTACCVLYIYRLHVVSDVFVIVLLLVLLHVASYALRLPSFRGYHLPVQSAHSERKVAWNGTEWRRFYRNRRHNAIKQQHR